MITLNDQKRVLADDRLDHLYMRNMRCPYCHTKMPKGTTKCVNCELTKEQIYYAQLATHRRKRASKQPVLYSKVRPADLPFWQMALSGLFGFLGAHCFVAKRYWRGLIILSFTILFFLFTMFIFPVAYEDVPSHWLRHYFESKTYPFPTDLFGYAAFILWVWDFVSILFRQFKYPVLIKTESPAA